MTVITNNQGAVKLSEIATDNALPSITTAISEDALTVLNQLYKLALDGHNSFHMFSDGRMRWLGQTLWFNSDNRANKLVVRLLKLAGTTRTIDLILHNDLVSNTATTFNNIALSNGDLLYLEIHKSQLASGSITVENAVNGGSVVSGKTLRKVNLTSSTGMPAINIDLSGDGEYLNIPIAFRYDWNNGVIDLHDLMWAPSGERWKDDTTVEIGASTAISSGGAILNFLEVSLKAWDGEVDTGGWNLYNDANPVPLDGTGGVVNSNLTFTVTALANEILSGKGSFVLNKAAVVNLQGHGVSVDFKIPRGYRRKHMIARFLYEYVSGFANDQIGIYVIADPDVSNILITPYQNIVTGINGEEVSSFDPLESYENYRLCIHIRGTETATFRLLLDEVKVNPIYFTIGDAIASPQAAGFVHAWSGTTDLDGWFICDGRSLPRASYPELFTNIGTAFGAPDGAHFNIPDFRGRFLRGTDNLATNDPDHASRTAMNAGGNTGNNVGSIQNQATAANGMIITDPGHHHLWGQAVGVAYNGGSGGTVWTSYSNGYVTSTSTTGITLTSTDNETRPKNASTNFLIKLFNDRKNTILSNSRVEYVSNTLADSTTSDLISFSSRIEGSLFPNIDNVATPVNLVRRINFSRPVNISDTVFIQTDLGTGGQMWVDCAQHFPYSADKDINTDVTFKEYGLSMVVVPGQPAQLDLYFRQNGAQKNHTWQFYNAWRYRVVLSSNPSAVETFSEDSPGVIKMYGGDNAPSGWLVCDGSAISRSTFQNLFNVIGTRFGSGDGSTTFNVMDARGLFPRGSLFPTIGGGAIGGVISAVNISTEVITIPNHGFNHTGFPVQFSGSLPSPLSASTTYFVIVIDQHTFAVATTHALAISNSRINLTTTTTGGSAVQWIDPDYASREAMSTGGSVGLGSYEADMFASHVHSLGFSNQPVATGPYAGQVTTSSTSTGATGGNETRSKNFMINFIIKY